MNEPIIEEDGVDAPRQPQEAEAMDIEAKAEEAKGVMKEE